MKKTTKKVPSVPKAVIIKANTKGVVMQNPPKPKKKRKKKNGGK